MQRTLTERFGEMLQQYVQKLTVRDSKATGLCPFHSEKTPSLSIDLAKAVFYCFGCGVSGGVKRFAELVGEPWESTHYGSRAAKAHHARLEAERQARDILQQCAAERNQALCTEYRKLSKEADGLASVLSLFHKRSDLAEEFPNLVSQTEQQYGNVMFRLPIVEAKLNGELE
jgi:hypothetical protein